MNTKTNIEEDIKKLKEEISRVHKINHLTATYVPIDILENILADREKYKQLYERTLSDLVSTEKEKETLKTKYETNSSKPLLTIENLKELEEHCKRQIQRYETGKKEKEEHLLILELLYTYQQNEAKANKYDSLIKEIEEQCKKDIEQARKEYRITLNDRQDGIREEAQNILELLDKQKEKI